jgi:hypothetical protein
MGEHDGGGAKRYAEALPMMTKSGAVLVAVLGVGVGVGVRMVATSDAGRHWWQDCRELLLVDYLITS